MSESDSVPIQHTQSVDWSRKLDSYNEEIKLLLNYIENVASRNKQKDFQVLVGKFKAQLNGCLKSINDIKNSPAIQQYMEFRETEERVAEILEKVLEELSTELSRFKSNNS